jgi:hypothetical protein
LFLGLSELEIAPATPGNSVRVERAAPRALFGTLVPLPPHELMANEPIDLCAEDFIKDAAQRHHADQDGDYVCCGGKVHDADPYRRCSTA